jgi:hypothetical protein
VEQIDDHFFVNQGAVSRGALVRENLERTPKVSLIEIENGEVRIKQISLSVAPAEDVFDLEKKATQERERTNIDQFVMRLLADSDFDPSVDIQSNIRSLSFAEDVRELALKYYELAEEEA